MKAKKTYIYHKPIKTQNRIIYPVIELKLNIVFDSFVKIKQKVVALKIVEDNLGTYYVNINMSKKAFSKLENM